MTESYELPVLFTDDECKAYAAWGMKKEKVLMPFALITILIYMVATVLVVMKVWGVRESDHLLFQMLLWGDWIPELTGALAVFMTILLLGPLNFILDKLWKKPAEPMWLCVVPEGGTVKVTAVRGLEGNPRTPAEIYPLTELETFLNPADNTICYQKKWYRIGENTIENIYPPEKQHPWMDHPENKASGIIDVQRLMEILKGYEASLKGKYETDFMECERAESLHAEGIPGFLSGNGCRYFLLTGDKIAGGTDRSGSARISSVLELRREKGLFRHCNFYKGRAHTGDLRHRRGGTRP